MVTGSQLLEAFRSLYGMTYRLEPPPDGVRTVDCSLAVLLAAAKLGLRPRGVRTAEQVRQACPGVVPWDSVIPGDLLFFVDTYDAAGDPGPDGQLATHVGISLGRGTRKMLDANDKNGVGETALGPWWQERILEARRLPGIEAGTPVMTGSPWGIDVSSHQGSVNWRLVREAGCNVGVTKVTEDDDYENPTARANWTGIRAEGMLRMGYHYAQPDDPQNRTDVRSEVEHFLRGVDKAGGLDTGDMVALDMESGEGDLGSWTLDFVSVLAEKTDSTPIIYTAPWFSDPHELDRQPLLANFPVWVAAYQDLVPEPPAPWTRDKMVMWQYTDRGSVPGVTGAVDMNKVLVPLAILRSYGVGVKPGALPDPRLPIASKFVVGSGILEMMKGDGTTPLTSSTWLPLGQTPADVEWAIGTNHRHYYWHLPTGTKWSSAS